MNRRSRAYLFAAWLVAIGIPFAAVAQDGDAPPEPEASSEHDERALAVARRMADALAGAKQIHLTTDIAYDAVQADGEAIEFGATRTLSLRKPDRMRTDVVDRSGDRRKFFFDGSHIWLSDESQGVFASVAHEGDIESMLTYVQDDLQLPTPFGELLSSDLYDHLLASDSAEWVDEQFIGGVLCDHLAFRNSEVGVQLWIPQEGIPAPLRIVIIYEQAPGQPHFSADIRDWDLSASFSDSHFEFKPDADAERIIFRAGALAVPGAKTMKEAK